MYTGDTALHVAAAAYQRDIAEALIAQGANVRARNRRGAEPLHYACDGVPGSPAWDPKAQAAIVVRLIEAGADPNSEDKSGVAPLHRAVRNRCSAAVRALLTNGSLSFNPTQPYGASHSTLTGQNGTRPGGTHCSCSSSANERAYRHHPSGMVQESSAEVLGVVEQTAKDRILR